MIQLSEVEGGGIDTCETELIENVEGSRIIYELSNVTGSNTVTSAEYAIDGDPTNYGYVNNGSCRLTPTGTIYVPPGFYLAAVNACSAGETNKMTAKFKNAGVVEVDYVRSDGQDTYLSVYSNTTNTVDELEYYEIVRINDNTSLANNQSYIAGLAVVPNGSGPYYFTDVELPQYMIQPIDTNVTLTFPSNQGFDCFEPGDVVQEISGNTSTTLTYLGYEAKDSNTQLGIGSSTFVKEEQFGNAPSGGSGALDQVLFDLQIPLSNVELGHLGRSNN